MKEQIIENGIAGVHWSIIVGSLVYSFCAVMRVLWRTYRDNKLINLANKQGRKISKFKNSKDGFEIEWDEK